MKDDLPPTECDYDLRYICCQIHYQDIQSKPWGHEKAELTAVQQNFYSTNMQSPYE
jgi:hypothetical protein